MFVKKSLPSNFISFFTVHKNTIIQYAVIHNTYKYNFLGFQRKENIFKFESIGHTFMLPDLYMLYNNNKCTIVILTNYSKGTK